MINKSVLKAQNFEEITPLISVVLPVYNGKKYLAEAIESVLMQTFVDFELIMIDDGSKDGSQDILIDYQMRDPRIRVIIRENRGLSITLNESIDIARGEWIARMDQDDIALPERFKKQLDRLDKTGADICGSWVRFFGTSDNRILKHAVSDEAIKKELLFCSAFAHPTVIMKTSKIKSLHYNSRWDKAEDYELWVRAVSAGWKMTNIPEVLLMYRQHNSQISTKSLVLQQKLTQKIRKIYWYSIADSVGVDGNEIDMVLKLRDPVLPKADIEVVHSVCTKILRRVSGESASIIFDHVTRLYYRLAYTSISVPFLWFSLNRKYGNKLDLNNFFKLLFLSFFKIEPSSNFFQFLKSMHFSKNESVL